MLGITDYSDGVLHDISFTLGEGENLVIIGANGTGKSTLARVLCSLIDNRSVTIDGEPLHRIPRKERKKLINYVPAELEIFDPYLSVTEFLELAFEGEAGEIARILEALDISHLSLKPCRELSSGESALVLIASALVHGARCTILDEPTANLDPRRTKAIYELLRTTGRLESRIIITHDLNLAKKLGYRLLYLHDGAIEYLGDSESFFEPENLRNYFGDSLKVVGEHVVVDL